MDGSLDSFYILQCMYGDNGEIEDFRFVEMNTRGATLLSRSRDEIVGQKMCEMFPANHVN